ncbi:MAG: RNA polymerase sigma factor [Hyphomicrobiales bacterium]|nr:RNA polymerase sigma factor [Hyphomicrobiales bacterium]
MRMLLPRLRRFAVGLTGSLDGADDLVQSTCERAIRSLDRFQPGSRLDSWMYKIMQNLHFNAVRDGRTRSRYIELNDGSADAAVDGIRAIEARLDIADLWRHIGELDPEQRAVLLLIAVEGYSYQETADLVGVPIGTVTSRLARARHYLRQRIDAWGGHEQKTKVDDRGVL